MSRLRISLDGVLAGARSEASKVFRKAKYSLEDKLAGFADPAAALESFYTCYTLQYALMARTDDVFPVNPGKVFAAMHGFYIGASEALEELENGSDGAGVRVAHSETPASFGNEWINTSRCHPEQHQRFMEILAGALSDPVVRRGRHVDGLARQYLEFIRDTAFDYMSGPDVADSLEVAKRLEIHFRGKVVKGLATGMRCRKPDAGAGWDGFIGYDEQKSYFQAIQQRIGRLDEVFRTTKDMFTILPNTLLYGPPGCGKTMLAETFAAQSGVPYFNLTLGRTGSSFVNASAQNVQKAFDEAAAPVRKGVSRVSIMYIDEITSLGRQRFDSGSKEDDKVVDTLLANMGRQCQVPGLMVIAGTNSVKVLSGPLRSRFVKILSLPAPDIGTQAKLLEYYAGVHNSHAEYAPFQGFDPAAMAEYCVHLDGSRFTPRDIANLFTGLMQPVITRRLADQDYVVGRKSFIDAIDRYKEERDVGGKDDHA